MPQLLIHSNIGREIVGELFTSPRAAMSHDSNIRVQLGDGGAGSNTDIA